MTPKAPIPHDELCLICQVKGAKEFVREWAHKDPQSGMDLAALCRVANSARDELARLSDLLPKEAADDRTQA